MSDAIDSSQGIGPAHPIGPVMNLKNQLKGLLLHKGMVAAELARKSGVSKQVISLWLAGTKPKNVEQVKRVADSLDVTVDHLLFGTGVEVKHNAAAGLDVLLSDEWISGAFEIKIRRIKSGHK